MFYIVRTLEARYNHQKKSVWSKFIIFAASWVKSFLKNECKVESYLSEQMEKTFIYYFPKLHFPPYCISVSLSDRNDALFLTLAGASRNNGRNAIDKKNDASTCNSWSRICHGGEEKKRNKTKMEEKRAKIPATTEIPFFTLASLLLRNHITDRQGAASKGINSILPASCLYPCRRKREKTTELVG